MQIGTPWLPKRSGIWTLCVPFNASRRGRVVAEGCAWKETSNAKRRIARWFKIPKLFHRLWASDGSVCCSELFSHEKGRVAHASSAGWQWREIAQPMSASSFFLVFSWSAVNGGAVCAFLCSFLKIFAYPVLHLSHCCLTTLLYSVAFFCPLFRRFQKQEKRKEE